MRERMLWLVNGILMIGTAALLVMSGVTPPQRVIARQSLPGSAPEAQSVTGLAYVTFYGKRTLWQTDPHHMSSYTL